MEKFFENFKTKYANNKNTFWFCFIATFVFGLVAYGFMFLSNNLSHDSMNEYVGGSSTEIGAWKMQLGRVFVPLYQAVTRSAVTSSWLIGILALVYIGIAVFLVVKLFDLKSKLMMILTAGVMTVNLTLIAQVATYINDLDCNALALLFAVLAVYLWRNYKWGFLFSILPITLTMGLYQAYVSVPITLIIFISLKDLLDGKGFKVVGIGILKAVAMIVAGGILYLGLMKLILAIADVNLVSAGEKYNAIDKLLYVGSVGDFFYIFVYVYYQTAIKLFMPVGMYSNTISLILNVALIGGGIILLLIQVFVKKIKVGDRILFCALIILLPLAINVCKIISVGYSHDLMHYSLWLTYLLAILSAQWNLEFVKSFNPTINLSIKGVICALFAIILINNVVLSNVVMTVRDFDSDASRTFYTRVLSDIEDNPDYVQGQTKIAFVGYKTPQLKRTLNGYPQIYEITGMTFSPYIATTFTGRYFEYIMQYDGVYATREELNIIGELEEVKNMPLYPDSTSIKIVDCGGEIGEVLVVKIGEFEHLN